jgi:hypothetical protein
MMKNTWKGIGVVVVLTSLLAAAVIPLVMADTEVPITCTVTAGVYSVSLNRYTVNYGTMAEDTSKEDPQGAINATNDAGMTQDLYIKGTKATYSAYEWVLNDTPGEDQYKHTFDNGTDEQSLSTSNKMLADNLNDGYSTEFTLKLYTPTTITAAGTYNVDVYVVATAP